jgi:hypothetical protein
MFFYPRNRNQRPLMAVSRRSGNEIHPWPPNGDLRPIAAGRRDRLVETKARKAAVDHTA